MKIKNMLLISSLVFSAHGASAQAPGNVYQAIFQSVSGTHLQGLLKNLSGVTPVTVGGRTFSITNRYSPAAKAAFRAYWADYFKNLGMTAVEMPYPTQHRIGETEGHNMEAVLPGRSPDSIVIIVHYDSMGKPGHETENPAADDDMTGMAVLMETARILTHYRTKLDLTVRFVAVDYEEFGGPRLEGSRQYAAFIKNLAAKNHFKLVASVDNEQSGWNCAPDGLCSEPSRGDVFDVFSCSGDIHGYDFKKLGDALEQTAVQFSQMRVLRGCMGAHSDHYAMWEIGVPAVVFSEHDPFNNPHFDQLGGDTFNKIDMNYFFRIAQIGVTFAARLVGVNQ